MKRKEEPTTVNLELIVWETNLVVCPVTIGVVNVGFLLEITRVIGWKGFHVLNGFVKFGNVILINQMSGTPNMRGGVSGR